MDKLKIIYRKFPECDVIALFPEIPGSNPWLCLCYQHIGQHGDADVNLVYDTKPANPDEYKDLHEELQSIYDCKLVVCKRFSYKMHKIRTESWHNVGILY
jgi:hypothetical protein